MYNLTKKSLKSIIPKQFLIKNELVFRKLFGVFYIGNKHECNICNKKLSAFVTLKNQDLLCPFCGSISRNRRLWKLLNKDHALKGKILHFSPSRSLYRTLKKNKTINYFSSDFENEFLADYNFDITNIAQKDATFDTIICYHILEHITDDKKAITELYRVLKPNGVIYIQTPFKTGDLYENDSITTPEERLTYFGQKDHVRVYSVKGLKSRLDDCGFNTAIINWNKLSEEDSYLGLIAPETILKASK
jgi:SAM-dependent methyltransferase